MANIRSFSFKLIPTIITLLAFLVMCKLGFWQLDRAEQKEMELKAFSELSVLTSQQLLQELQTRPESLHGRRAHLSGDIDLNQVWLVDNKTHNGRVGYSVVVKLRMSKDDVSKPDFLLVDLGWIPAGQYRDKLPNIELPANVVIEATLKAKNFEQLLLDDAKEQLSPQRVQTYRQIFLQDVPPLVAFADSDSINGMPQLYQPVVMPPEKHVAYAVQWFLLAIASLVVFSFASYKKTNRIEVEKESNNAS
ncbi:MAG: SURF1 family protein [Gammaproteobacteria bacterium]|nr:SURF1 family protein [Gammaproteobacteria bacterium]